MHLERKIPQKFAWFCCNTLTSANTDHPSWFKKLHCWIYQKNVWCASCVWGIFPQQTLLFASKSTLTFCTAKCPIPTLETPMTFRNSHTKIIKNHSPLFKRKTAYAHRPPTKSVSKNERITQHRKQTMKHQRTTTRNFTITYRVY